MSKTDNNHKDIAEQCRAKVAVVDIETSSPYPIKDFDNYVRTATVKWLGVYSYTSDRYYELDCTKLSKLKIQEFLNAHDALASFNGIEFDIPILENNGMMPEKRMHQVDCQVILGTDKFKHKNRGMLMGYKFKNNKLATMAKTMKLETMKGDIDYSVFEKNEWTEEETADIKKYLRGDIEVTKQMFDKLYSFWEPFTEMLSEKNVKNWAWLTSSVASMSYKADCYEMDNEEEYGDKTEGKEDIGGLVILPTQTEAKDVWYVDVTSLYPHMYIMFNLFNEIDVSSWTQETIDKQIAEGNLWHGNDVFTVNGYYRIDKHGQREQAMAYKLQERMRLKSEDPDNPLVYAYKILLNATYGINRSTVFKNIHTPNSGSDCCLLGQQVNKIMQDKFGELGYKTLSGDTDSIFTHHSENKTVEQVQEDCKTVVDYINANTLFPVPTFDIDIETGDKLDYVMWVPDEKTGKFKKKNYVYIYNSRGKKAVKIMGLPIKKSNATELGMSIFKEHIEQKMLDEVKGKFDKDWIAGLIKDEVQKNMDQMVVEYKTSPFDTYSVKGRNGINAQASLIYLGGKGGTIKLLKNKKVGKIGKAFKYCTIDEAHEAGLTYHDLDLTKVFKELYPFANGKIEFKKTRSFF